MKQLTERNLFVPGRICLVGELSDWTTEYKSENRDIVAGEAIVTGIDLGIYATARKYSSLKFDMDDNHFECEMDESLLEKEAISKSFYSYICGCSLHMLRKYGVSGIYIDIKYNTLPIKKGLSSSAAVCVLMVKAFNEVYNLSLSDNEIMSDAYFGEHLALSACGRLDQLIVKGNKQLFKAIFHESCVSLEPIHVEKELNLVIADLMATKDTRKILSSLRGCYPFAKNKNEERVHEMMEEKNQILVSRMKKAIALGDLKEVGHIFTDSQKLIDEAGIPICDEYKAPVLHKTMEDEFIKKNSYGSRGVGSGGDGTIQILAKDRKTQDKLVYYLNNTLGMEAFKFDIKETHKVKKAIIPVAGFGTRMYPVTRAIKKAFLPINDGKTIKPLLLKLVEELDEVGIEEICLVIGPEDRESYDAFFKKSLKSKNLDKLDQEIKEYDFNILRIGEKIKYVVQEEQKGFGHAIYLCKEFAKNDPVLVVLGDTYFSTDSNKSCIRQIVDYYDEVGKNIIGMGEIADDEIENVGIMAGTWDDEEHTKLSVNRLVEKPNKDYAKEQLQVDGKCYGNFGMWIINQYVFNQIESNILNEIKSRGEYQFVDAIAQLIEGVDVKALKIDGKSHDLGNVNSYQKTLLSGLLNSNKDNNFINGINDLETLINIKNMLEKK